MHRQTLYRIFEVSSLFFLYNQTMFLIKVGKMESFDVLQ